MATESILIRHGQTVWNPQSVLQAMVAARYVADHRTPTAICYSPTSKTAPCTVEQMVGLTTCPRSGEPNLHETCI